MKSSVKIHRPKGFDKKSRNMDSVKYVISFCPRIHLGFIHCVQPPPDHLECGYEVSRGWPQPRLPPTELQPRPRAVWPPGGQVPASEHPR